MEHSNVMTTSSVVCASIAYAGTARWERRPAAMVARQVFAGVILLPGAIPCSRHRAAGNRPHSEDEAGRGRLHEGLKCHRPVILPFSQPGVTMMSEA